MLYFIPAWYLKNEWKEDEQLWHRRRMKTETDDTVKQIQLFQRNSICEYKILLLSYAPNLRHFLHRQGVFRVPYWSVFDAIQEVKRKKQAVLSFHNLNWPRDIEFIYTPFSIAAMLNQEKYALIEFGEYGNPIEVNLYRDGQISRKNIYDDRGFISCTSVYENGSKAYEQYLTEKGVWKLCHFADGHVVVNPRSNQYLIHISKIEKQISFLKNTYDSMEEVIEEVFRAALETTRDADMFCAAVHRQHLRLLDRLLADRKTCFSLFEKRFPLDGNQDAVEILSRGNYIVTDSEETLVMVSRQKGLENMAKKSIPPYDTRMEPGISQQINVQKILVPVDHLPAGILEEAVKQLAAYLEKNRDARVHLFTRNAEFSREDVLLKKVREILKRNDYPPEWARKVEKSKSENPLDEEDQLPVLFIVEQCVNELSVNKCVREQRLLVDLADTPDLFLQVSCVSMGIPQILRTATQYMYPGKNGRINRNLDQLEEDLGYYLENLSNWNEAAIQSYELGKTYTTQYLIKQWKEVIANIGNSTGIATGNRRLQ